MSRWTRRYTSIRLEDANGLGLPISPMEGDFSGGDENDSNRSKTRVMNRQDYDADVEGDELEQEISFTVQMESQTLTHATLARIKDFLKRQGSFAAAVTTNPNPTVWSFKCIVSFSDGSNTGGTTYPNCKGTISWSEGDPVHTFAVSLTNNGAPVDS